MAQPESSLTEIHSLKLPLYRKYGEPAIDSNCTQHRFSVENFSIPLRKEAANLLHLKNRYPELAEFFSDWSPAVTYTDNMFVILDLPSVFEKALQSR